MTSVKIIESFPSFARIYSDRYTHYNMATEIIYVVDKVWGFIVLLIPSESTTIDTTGNSGARRSFIRDRNTKQKKNRSVT